MLSNPKDKKPENMNVEGTQRALVSTISILPTTICFFFCNPLAGRFGSLRNHHVIYSSAISYSNLISYVVTLLYLIHWILTGVPALLQGLKVVAVAQATAVLELFTLL